MRAGKKRGAFRASLRSAPLAALGVCFAAACRPPHAFGCYKPVFSHEKSRAIIIESSGTHFDPSVVEAFCELEEQFREVRDSMED